MSSRVGAATLHAPPASSDLTSEGLARVSVQRSGRLSDASVRMHHIQRVRIINGVDEGLHGGRLAHVELLYTDFRSSEGLQLSLRLAQLVEVEVAQRHIARSSADVSTGESTANAGSAACNENRSWISPASSAAAADSRS